MDRVSMPKMAMAAFGSAALCLLLLAPGKVTGFLVELAPGATTLQARFAILSTLKGVKVVTGDSTMSGIRQGLAALLDGIGARLQSLYARLAAGHVLPANGSSAVCAHCDHAGLCRRGSWVAPA